MKAMVIDDFGGLDRLTLREMPDPVPAEDEIRIKIAYCGVNPVDWKLREGMLAEALPHEFPLILGWEAAGTVDQLGGQVRDFRPGDRVYAYCRKPVVQWGTYCEYVTVKARVAAPAPANLELRQAAVIPLTGLTAWQALFDFAGLAEGQTVLIHAGAGGVGSYALQYARYAKAGRIYTTAGEMNHDYVRDLGAQVPIDYRSQDFVSALKAAEPAGVDVIFDTVGGETQRHSYEVLKPGGVLVSIVDPPDEGIAGRYGVRAGYVFVEPNGEQLRTIARLFESGILHPPQIREMALEEAASAQEKSRAGHVRGKIVLKVE
ncbi:MAG: NADP-dependent oxidoreductase [Candidatus Competibacteraceae bacterium]|nr:NADP-dependent oxidoreductase [Candidatus Competibacteraceae bacterium]